jgi:hypothetical protein
MPVSQSEHCKSKTTPSLAGDILFGAEAIAEELGVDIRRAFYMLSHGHIPGRKIGGTWVTTRSALRRFIETGVDA